MVAIAPGLPSAAHILSPFQLLPKQPSTNPSTQPITTLPISALPAQPLPGAAPYSMPPKPPVRKATCFVSSTASQQTCSARHCSNDAEPNSQYCSQCLCKQCNRSPRNIGFDFCGRACGAAWDKAKANPVAKPVPECEIPDCHRPVWQDVNGSYSRWCGRSHRALAEQKAAASAKDKCLQCKTAVAKPGWLFCSAACEADAHKSAPQLLEIPKSHEIYSSIKHQFEDKWRHNKQPPTVRHIYKICCNPKLLAEYTAYRDNVEASRKLEGQKASSGPGLMTAGNEQRRWHGTTRLCRLGDNGETDCCNDTGCNLCSIIRTSFDIGRWASNTKWGRFGKGIYVSATASKANDYSRNVDGFVKTKAVLLNKVVVGRGCKLKQNDDTLTEPPKGFDSVLGETGQDLNHDEVVVYKNEAIRPSYLVIYDKPPYNW